MSEKLYVDAGASAEWLHVSFCQAGDGVLVLRYHYDTIHTVARLGEIVQDKRPESV